MIQGRSGNGVDDLYLLEINGQNEYGVSTTKSLDLTKNFDDMKLQGLLNQINGLDHTGVTNVGVPTIFGMNFQAVSVAQRLKTNKTITGATATGSEAGPGGYLDGTGTPSSLLTEALDHTDASLGQIIAELHDTDIDGRRVTIDDMCRTLEAELGFTMRHRYGPVCVFEK